MDSRASKEISIKIKKNSKCIEYYELDNKLNEIAKNGKCNLSNSNVTVLLNWWKIFCQNFELSPF